MSEDFGDLEGVEFDIDDIIVHAETEVQHDHRLQAVLERCEKINLTLNKDKCVFKVKEVTYIGHKLTQEGMKPDEKVCANKSIYALFATRFVISLSRRFG